MGETFAEVQKDIATFAARDFDFGHCLVCGGKGNAWDCPVSGHGPLRFGTLDRGLDWVIVGGESGPKARPFDVAWARTVVGQCKAAGVPCFVKQLGDRAMCRADSLEGRRAGDHPEREWPIGTLFGTAPGHMGTEWQGRHAQGKAPYENGRCVGLPVRLARACSDPSEWPEDLRVREFPEVRRG